MKKMMQTRVSSQYALDWDTFVPAYVVKLNIGLHNQYYEFDLMFPDYELLSPVSNLLFKVKYLIKPSYLAIYYFH